MDEKVLEFMGELFKALAHPLRLKILQSLRAGERCVCEVIPAVGAEQSVVSKHLALLRQVGVLECRKEGLRVIYWVRHPVVFKIYDLAQDFILHRLTEMGALADDTYINCGC